MDYKEELFNTLEQFLLDNDIYSQFTTYVLEHFKLSLSEFFDNYFIYSRGSVSYLFYNYWRDSALHKKWIRIAIEIEKKYERGV